MKTSAKWLLALLVGGVFVAPAWVAEGQIRRPKTSTQNRSVRMAAAPLPRIVTFAGGEFVVGSDDGDSDAKPAHRARVDAFSIQRQEVTVADYKLCVDAKKCFVPGTGPDCNWGQAGRNGHPINCVDYYQATAYCTFVGMRLPTEQEWEFAAKSPDNRTYPWGSTAPKSPPSPDRQLCWGAESTCRVGPRVEGRSASDLDDMSGNVAEWTSSPFCPYLSGCESTDEAKIRAVRGGGWSLKNAKDLQTSSREGFGPRVRSATIGFRCAGAPNQQ